MNNQLSIEFLQSRVARLRELSRSREFESIICAGGAIRDLILKRPVKDLDFFIEGRPDEEFLYGRIWEEFYFNTQNRCREKAGSVKKVEGKLSSGYTCGTKIVVYEANPGWYGYPVQFIFNTEDDVRKDAEEDFDFGFCRAWCDDRRLRLSKFFHEDANNQRITAYPSSRTAAPDRDERIKAKYAGWKFRDLRRPKVPVLEFTTCQEVVVEPFRA